MIEVYPSLFVGSQTDLIHVDDGAGGIKEGWFVISAAKTFHREALGYKTRGAPKDHPEYLFAIRERRLLLNLIDSDNPEFVPDEIVHAALEQIDEAFVREDKTLIHCNQGQSRAPTIALLWLHGAGDDYEGLDYDQAAALFRETYPDFNPSKGMEGYAREHWDTPA